MKSRISERDRERMSRYHKLLPSQAQDVVKQSERIMVACCRCGEMNTTKAIASQFLCYHCGAMNMMQPVIRDPRVAQPI